MNTHLHPISVRRLTSADAEVYRAVRIRALSEQPPAFGSLPENEAGIAELAARLSDNPDEFFFGVFQESRLVGTIRVCRHDAPNERHRAYFAGFYVRPSSRNQGCGKALLKAALDHTSSDPAMRRVNLSVVTQQAAAIRLYTAFGFRIYGTEVEAFSNSGLFYDEHLMTLELSPRENLIAVAAKDEGTSSYSCPG